MTRNDLQSVIDMALDIGKSPLHRVSFTHSDTVTVIWIHFLTKYDTVGNVCSFLQIQHDEDLTAKHIEWLTNWKAVIETERDENARPM